MTAEYDRASDVLTLRLTREAAEYVSAILYEVGLTETLESHEPSEATAVSLDIEEAIEQAPGR